MTVPATGVALDDSTPVAKGAILANEAYNVTAEFYDLLQALEYRQRATSLLERWWDRPQVGVLDAGAGTGVAVELVATRSVLPVYAVEPAAAMRAVLLSRLAGHPQLLDRVTVYATGMDRLGVHRIADFALCLNVLGTLDRPTRRRVLAGLARALVPGARLLVQRPPQTPGPARAELPSWRLGRHRYDGWVTCTPAGPRGVRWRFTYQVSDADAVVREASEEFAGFLQEPEEFDQDLRAAGFEPVDRDEPDVVVAHRRY